MRLWRALVVLVALAGGAQAQQIDFARLFEENADKISEIREEGRTVSVLEMPGQVTLRRIEDEGGQASYQGIDWSGDGAVGCLFQLQLEIDTLSRLCRRTLPARKDRLLRERFERVRDFVARNSFPPMSAEEMSQQIDSFREARTQVFDQAECAESVPNLLSFAGVFASDAFEASLDKALAVPRLPVTNPCL